MVPSRVRSFTIHYIPKEKKIRRRIEGGEMPAFTGAKPNNWRQDHQ
jgi:hypothetical protein